ncbi:MAG: deoxyribonuclease IV [Candidatus Eremiobacteraeota bacterium]|nr:deoxyribonuclease IV [Candidatus Eremiobacteraeota bacterium]
MKAEDSLSRRGATRLLGAHMSIAGGVHTAFQRAEKAGCTALQIFTRNNMQWETPPLAGGASALFSAERKRTGIETVVAHSNYLINLASPSPPLRERSLRAMKVELTRAESLAIAYLVIHPGNHMGAGEEEGERLVAEALHMLLETMPSWRGMVLLETTAGQGTGLGATFESLGRMRALAPRIGFCLDTCHVFAAGYDMRTSRACRDTLKRFDDTLGLGNLMLLHCNDSKGDLGSRLDRHAHIGKGFLGLNTFRNLLADDRLAAVPFIIETPKGKDRKGVDLDVINLATLRKLLPC